MKTVIRIWDNEATWTGDKWECENKSTGKLLNEICKEVSRGHDNEFLDRYVAQFIVEELSRAGITIVSLSDEDSSGSA